MREKGIYASFERYEFKVQDKSIQESQNTLPSSYSNSLSPPNKFITTSIETNFIKCKKEKQSIFVYWFVAQQQSSTFTHQKENYNKLAH